jgi:hypothetical protein
MEKFPHRKRRLPCRVDGPHGAIYQGGTKVRGQRSRRCVHHADPVGSNAIDRGEVTGDIEVRVEEIERMARSGDIQIDSDGIGQCGSAVQGGHAAVPGATNVVEGTSCVYMARIELKRADRSIRGGIPGSGIIGVQKQRQFSKPIARLPSYVREVPGRINAASIHGERAHRAVRRRVPRVQRSAGLIDGEEMGG